MTCRPSDVVSSSCRRSDTSDAVDVPHAAVEADVPAVPAVGQPCADDVLTVRERGGDVEGPIAQTVAVAAPPGRETIVSRRGAPLSSSSIDAVRRRVDPRADDVGGIESECVEVEAGAQEVSGAKCALRGIRRRRDEVGPPVARDVRALRARVRSRCLDPATRTRRSPPSRGTERREGPRDKAAVASTVAVAGAVVAGAVPARTRPPAPRG